MKIPLKGRFGGSVYKLSSFPLPRTYQGRWVCLGDKDNRNLSMVYQRKSGMNGKLKTIAVCVTTLLLSLASFDAARGAITNTTQNTTYNTIQAAIDKVGLNDDERSMTKQGRFTSHCLRDCFVRFMAQSGDLVYMRS